MATEGSNSVATIFLFLNLLLYAIVAVIAGWAVNYGIDETLQSVSELSLPARLFPIYYPIGNLATGFFIVFSLIAGLVGAAVSLTGLQNVLRGSRSGLLSTAASSVIALGLTLLAMGLACKEISIGWRTGGLRALETLIIILSATQLLCAGAIHAELLSASSQVSQPRLAGRV